MRIRIVNALKGNIFYVKKDQAYCFPLSFSF